MWWPRNVQKWQNHNLISSSYQSNTLGSLWKFTNRSSTAEIKNLSITLLWKRTFSWLHPYCWRMLETTYVGDKSKMLVIVFVIFVTYIHSGTFSSFVNNLPSWATAKPTIKLATFIPQDNQNNLLWKKVSNEFLKWIQIADILIFYSWSEIGGVSNSVQISNCFGLVTQMPN